MFCEILFKPLAKRFPRIAGFDFLDVILHLVEYGEQSDVAVPLAEPERALGEEGMADHVCVG